MITQAQSNPESRFDRDSWIVAAITFLYIAVSIIMMMIGFRFPSDGWKYDDNDEERGPLAVLKISGDLSPLQAGDVVVALNGQPIRGLVLRPADAPAVWRSGGTVRYSVLRNKQTLDLEVPLGRQSLTYWLRFMTTTGNHLEMIASLANLILCLYVFVRRPRNIGARALFLAFSMWFVGDNILGTYNSVGLRFTSPAYFYGMEFLLLSWGWWLLPTLISFVLVFPVRQGPMRRHAHLTLSLLYALPIGLTGVAMVADDIQVFDVTLAVLAIVFLLTLIFSAAHTLRTNKDAIVRTQFRWMAFGLILSVVLSLVWFQLSVWLPSSPLSGLLEAGRPLFSMIFPFCAAIAILRYRLFDIDIIINRALVYGALTALVIILYVIVVGYLGSLMRTGNNLLISLTATSLVAVLFQPMRDRLQIGVNRLMYGQRDEPVAVLSQLGARLEKTIVPDEMLPGLVDTVAKALKLPYAAITLQVADQFQVKAERGQASAQTEEFPLIHQGETIGQLLVARRSPGEEFNPADRLLLTNIARQAGSVAQSVRLTSALQRSRQQLVTAREEERRRLRRDLHDGLGPQLASQTLTIEAIKKLLEADPQKSKELLEHLKTQAQAAIQDIRRLVYGLRPPALDELGLVEAIREGVRQFGQVGGSIEIETDPQVLPSLPAAVEVAVYRIAQEAITNVLRHSQANQCTVSIKIHEHQLDLTITDDGKGYPANFHFGVGLNSMRERAEELGGTIRFENNPKGGARVQVWLPLPGENE